MRRTPAVAAAAIALIFATACDPQPPPLELTVDTAGEGADHDPGDGTCATSEGHCTLRAAVEEAEQHPSTIIYVAVPSLQLDGELPTVTSTIEIRGEVGRPTISGAAEQAAPILAVGVDGFLTLRGLDVRGGVHVEGTLVTDKVSVSQVNQTQDLPAVTVAEDGRLVALTSIFQRFPLSNAPAVHNEGTAVLSWSQVGGLFAFRFSEMSLGELHTAPTATSAVQATFLASSCTGRAPTSYSHNADSATGCGLDGAGDVSDAPQWRTLLSEEIQMPAEVLDAVDAGTIGCGANTDIASNPRPAASTPGAPVRCDIGALEQQ